MPRQYSACFPGNANQTITKSRPTIRLKISRLSGHRPMRCVLVHEPAPRKRARSRAYVITVGRWYRREDMRRHFDNKRPFISVRIDRRSSRQVMQPATNISCSRHIVA